MLAPSIRPARNGEDKRHGHVGGVFRQHVRRVGDSDALACGGVDVDVIDAVGKACDQFQLRSGLFDQRCIDPVGEGRNEHVGALHRCHEFRLAARRVVDVELGVEQLAHARFNDIRQFAGDVDLGLFLVCHRCLPSPC